MATIPTHQVGLFYLIMPYKNIVFVKLEKRLLNDHRWFGMSDRAQLLYVKLMLGCAETYNKLPTDSLTLRKQLRIGWRKDVFDSAIKEIISNFPKFRKVGNFYQFDEFETKTNYIRETLGQSQIIPKDGVDIEKEKEKEGDRGELSLLFSYWSVVYGKCLAIEQDLIEYLFTKFGFKHTKRLIREFREKGFRSIDTMRNSLDEKGNIKPRDSKDEGIVIEKVG